MYRNSSKRVSRREGIAASRELAGGFLLVAPLAPVFTSRERREVFGLGFRSFRANAALSLPNII
jgi:hypothetical protein